MRAVKKSFAVSVREALRSDAFRIEPLEPRVLLSADPILAPLKLAILPDWNDIKSLTDSYIAAQQSGAPAITAPLLTRLLARANTDTSNNFVVDAVLFDIGQLSTQQGFMDSSLRVAANETLGGSGNLNVALLNAGVVSPGYSPGVQNVSSYTQTSTGKLAIEIGGTGAGQYDQINSTGTARLDGKLAISLIGGYKPAEGDTFTIMTYGDVAGRFDSSTGLLQSSDGFYFEVSEGKTTRYRKRATKSD